MKALVLTFFAVILVYSLFFPCKETLPEPALPHKTPEPYYDKAPDVQYADTIIYIENQRYT